MVTKFQKCRLVLNVSPGFFTVFSVAFLTSDILYTTDGTTVQFSIFEISNFEILNFENKFYLRIVIRLQQIREELLSSCLVYGE